METEEKKATPKQNIILDSNIIQYTADKFASQVFVQYLSDLLKRGFGLAISDISIFELLKGAYVKKENEMLQLLSIFIRYYLVDRVLVAAAQLETLYKLDGIDPKQIEAGDKLIGSTAILTGSLILTANARDFPSQYFPEVERKPLMYSIKNKNNFSKCILVTLLNPDINMISQKFSERPNE